MDIFKVHRVTRIPNPRENNSIYVVTESGDKHTLYITDDNASISFRLKDLTEGDGISIQNNVVSLSQDILDLITDKQMTLFEGENITIDKNNVISAKDTTYTGIGNVKVNSEDEIDLTQETKDVLGRTFLKNNEW